MKALIISHTYISVINRDKWITMAERYPELTLHIVFPTQWPTCLFNHEATIQTDANKKNCTFSALHAKNTGNEVLYYYHHNELYNLIKTYRPDIVQVEQGQYALSYLQTNVYIKLLRLPTKSIFFTWINWKPKLSLKQRFFFAPVQKTNFLCADGAITGNHDAAELLRQNGFSGSIAIIPQLGINTTIFAPADSPKLQKKIKKTISYIGRFADEKGVFLLLSAFSKISVIFHDWHLQFVGTGPAFSAMQDFITKHHLTNRVSMNPPVQHKDVASYLEATDILVLPSYDTTSWREQFGHILIEAMGCGIAVIGSDAGEIPHVIKNAGLIFEQNNERSLLAQLETLMQDEELRKKIGALGNIRAHTQYSHAAIADQTYHFWQKLM